MQKKQGISLIVLVITIIVMIILAASVVITLSNTGVINRASQAVDLTNEAAVQDLAALVWADAYMDNKRGTDLVNEVTTKLGEQGVTSDKWNITVTDTGVSVTSKTSGSVPTPGTLGYLINSAEDYGKTIDYNANGINDWKILYEDETNGYVFLITTDTVETLSAFLPASSDLISVPSSITESQKGIYNIFKLGDKQFDLNMSYFNNRFVAKLITDYSHYANTAVYGDNVVGAIGGPTVELLAAGYNATVGENKIIPIIDENYSVNTDYGFYEFNGEYGYFINNKNVSILSGLTTDGLYLLNNKTYWTATPSAYDNGDGIMDVYRVSGTSINGGYVDIEAWGIRPVVCLKASIPATVGTTTDFSLVK